MALSYSEVYPITRQGVPASLRQAASRVFRKTSSRRIGRERHVPQILELIRDCNDSVLLYASRWIWHTDIRLARAGQYVIKEGQAPCLTDPGVAHLNQLRGIGTHLLEIPCGLGKF